MIQLKYDNSFNIIEDKSFIWRKTKDIPDKIKRYINDLSNEFIIYDKLKDKKYCSNCLNELDNNYTCHKCNKVFNNFPYKKYVMETSIDNIKEYKCYIEVAVFDIFDNNVVLYIIDDSVEFNNPYSFIPKKINRILNIEPYEITANGVFDINRNIFMSFKRFTDLEKGVYIPSEDVDFDTLGFFLAGFYDRTFIYTDNLIELKNISFYKYSHIWDMKDYFTKTHFNICSLTYFPIYCKEYEYLVKLQLYNLANKDAFRITYNKNFKMTFGVDKKHYSFMKEIDINYDQLLALWLCPTYDLDLLNYIGENIFEFDSIKDIVDITKVIVYLKKQKLEDHLSEYVDYLNCCRKLKMDLKSNRVLFPKNLIEEHDKIFLQVTTLNNPEINNRIKELSTILEINKYEDDKYVIFPADSIESLIDESYQQHNCVRTYCEDYSNNKTQIYFMRRKENIDKSFVTIEVVDGKMVQAKVKYNERPDVETEKILISWEKTIVPIEM